MAEMLDAGEYILDVDDDTGQKFWRGSSPGDKGETYFDPGVCLVLSPDHWPVGTRVRAEEPPSEPQVCGAASLSGRVRCVLSKDHEGAHVAH